MAYQTDIEKRTYDAIGAASDTILSALDAATIADVASDALWTVARMLPHELLLKLTEDDTDIEVLNSANTKIIDKILLHVEKNDGTNFVPCKEISITESEKALNADSVYKATDASPVYWLDSNEKIKFAPDTADEKGARYYAYTRQILPDLSDDLVGLPKEAYGAVIYLTASDIIKTALHTFTEDESPEEYALWKTHSDELLNQFAKEIKTIKGIEGDEA